MPDAPFKSMVRVARVLQICFAAWMLLGGLAVASSLVWFRVVDRFVDDPLSVTFSQLQAAGDRQDVIGITQIIALIAVGVVFMVWMSGLYQNLPALGRKARFKHGWAVGGWFVPFLNLWRPKQIIDDIWTCRPAEQRESPRVPPLLNWWWGLWVGSGILGWLLFRNGASTDVDSARTQAIGILAADVAEVVAAVLAFWVVTSVTARQEAQFRLVRAPAEGVDERGEANRLLDPNAGRNRTLVAVGLPAIAVLTFVVAFALWDDPSSSSQGSDQPPQSTAAQSEEPLLASAPLADSGVGTLLEELKAGDCFDLPPDFNELATGTQPVLAVEVLPCAEAHELEVVATISLEFGAGAGFPGDEQVILMGLSMCAQPFESHVGVPWWVSGLDVFVIHPGADTWAIGDREVLCSARPVSGDLLEGPLAGSGGVLRPSERTVWGLDGGECFNDPPDFDGFVVEVVSCDRPHDNQTYAVVSHDAAPGEHYPGAGVLAAFATEACASEFAQRVDTSVRGGLDFGAYSWPVEPMWDAGHRSVICIVWGRGFQKLTESALTES
ncbi:MAG: DUF4328 domain-containing protein [Acidimicrobiales bacterium]